MKEGGGGCVPLIVIKHTHIHTLAAYDILTDKDKRHHYDMFRAEGPQAQQQQYHGGPFDYDAFFGKGSGNSGFEHRFNFNFDDLFKEFFGDDDFGDFFQESHHTHRETHGHNSTCQNIT